MTKHLLTEADCDALRAGMLNNASQHSGPAFKAWMDAVQLLDQASSDSFLRRAAAKSGLSKVLPPPRKALGMRYTR